MSDEQDRETLPGLARCWADADAQERSRRLNSGKRDADAQERDWGRGVATRTPKTAPTASGGLQNAFKPHPDGAVVLAPASQAVTDALAWANARPHDPAYSSHSVAVAVSAALLLAAEVERLREELALLRALAPISAAREREEDDGA